MNSKNICTILSLYIATLENEHKSCISSNRISEITTYLNKDCMINKIRLKLNLIFPLEITNHCSTSKNNTYYCKGLMSHLIEKKLNQSTIIEELCGYDKYKFLYDVNGNVSMIQLFKDEKETTCNFKK